MTVIELRKDLKDVCDAVTGSFVTNFVNILHFLGIVHLMNCCLCSEVFLHTDTHNLPS